MNCCLPVSKEYKEYKVYNSLKSSIQFNSIQFDSDNQNRKQGPLRKIPPDRQFSVDPTYRSLLWKQRRVCMYVKLLNPEANAEIVAPRTTVSRSLLKRKQRPRNDPQASALSPKLNHVRYMMTFIRLLFPQRSEAQKDQSRKQIANHLFFLIPHSEAANHVLFGNTVIRFTRSFCPTVIQVATRYHFILAWLGSILSCQFLTI